MSDYKILKDTWIQKEDYFVSYAVRGPLINPSYALRAGMPQNCCPENNSPVKEPSPLNSQKLVRES